MVVERFATQRTSCILCGGKQMSGLDCTCAGEAMWLFRASQGKIITDHCKVRDLTDDCIGGTNLNQMEKVSQHFGITTGKVYQPVDIDVIFDMVESNKRASHLNVSYRPFIGTPYDRFGGRFGGNHDLYLSAKGVAPETIRVGDPGAAGFVDIPKSLLIRGAGLLELKPGVTLNAYSGAGKCYAYVTPPDPVVSVEKYRVSIFGGADHVTPLYTAPNGTRAGGVTFASYIVQQAKVSGLWWYKILTKVDGTYTSNKGKWFKPTRYMKFVDI